MPSRRAAWATVIVVAAAVAASCGAERHVLDAPTTTWAPNGTAVAIEPPRDSVVRLAFAGDVMLGRRVAAVVAADPDSIFERTRFVLGRADLAMANLESPFGTGEAAGDLTLVADPSAAALLARAGFDAMSLANNHAGDAGPGSVAGTAGGLSEAGLATLGLTDTQGAAPAVVVERNGLRVALLAFDLTRQSPPGEIAHWDADIAASAVADAQAQADLVAVSLHGGVEYLPAPDPALASTVTWLAERGVDVVWAHGSHVTYPVIVVDPDGDGRITLAAHGLGNFLFDQRIVRTEEGLLLEVLAGADGVRAYRIGEVAHADLRTSVPEWRLPDGDAVLVDGGWWALAEAAVVPNQVPLSDSRLATLGDLAAAGRGDVDGDGEEEVVAAFMRPRRLTLINERFDDVEWSDGTGRSAHIGVYAADTLRPEWVAGSVPFPVVALAVCGDGTVAMTHRELDGGTVIGAGAWWWRDFGFAAAPLLPGEATPVCHDVDGDGHSNAAVLRDLDP